MISHLVYVVLYKRFFFLKLFLILRKKSIVKYINFAEKICPLTDGISLLMFCSVFGVFSYYKDSCLLVFLGFLYLNLISHFFLGPKLTYRSLFFDKEFWDYLKQLQIYFKENFEILSLIRQFLETFF